MKTEATHNKTNKINNKSPARRQERATCLNPRGKNYQWGPFTMKIQYKQQQKQTNKQTKSKE